MDLRFEGDISIWLGIVLAILAAVLIFWLYHRETSRRTQRWAILLPLIRAVAVVLLILMLTGPVLHGTVNVADLSRVLLFVDGSQSMSLTDETMAPERKLLVAKRLGWEGGGDIDTSIYDAAGTLSLVQLSGDTENLQEDIRTISRQLHRAWESIRQDEVLARQFHSDLITPIAELAARMQTDEEQPLQWREELGEIVDAADRWRLQLKSEFTARAGVISASDRERNDSTEKRFDQLSRWQRVESLLVSKDDALLPQLVGKHHVDLLALAGETDAGGQPVRIWQPFADAELPESLEPMAPTGTSTDLASEVSSVVGQLPQAGRLAVVMFTDGQHNHKGADTPTPLHVAKQLAHRGVPIFAVGVGAANPPKDLAVLAVQTPESVFADDRVKGEILIKDNLPAGQPMRVQIEIEGQQVWSDQLTTSQSGARTVDFDFSIKRLVEDRLAGSLTETEVVSMPLPLEVSIVPIDGELREDNNSHAAHVRAITRPRRALLIDGRPRWEFRYLRNMLDRDDHWEVSQVLADFDGNRHRLPRGSGDQEFPASRKQLFGYDLVVIGEVPSDAFGEQELQWLNQFVASRGGGLMLIDGRRGKLRSYPGTPLDFLFPVRFIDDHRGGHRNVTLSLTDRGKGVSALAFQSDTESTVTQWNELPALRWVAPAEALPGCETLLEANSASGTTPALVMRRFGAGTVLYSAFDDSWRWRYEAGDLYHQQYWNQIANFVMEPPYAVHDRYVSLDTGGFTYQDGESAELKVRLRDRRGNPVVDANAEAILYRDEEVVAAVPLAGGAESGGVFRGQTKKLSPGTYQVGVMASGFAEDQLSVRAEFVVLGDQTGEMNVLYCDEPLLKQMAELSGGQYLREEDINRLPELLAPYSDDKEATTEIALWRSWLWFLPLVGLFTVEWLLRKRLGLM